MIYTPDCADLFIAAATGEPISKVMRPSIDIKKAVGGSSFPLHFVAAGDADIIPLDYVSAGLLAADPLEILLAREAAGYALNSDFAADYLALADIQEIDTRKIAEREGITRRRVQQIRAENIAAAHAGQRELDFSGGEK